MKKNYISNILKIVLLLIFVILILNVNNKVNAAGASITANSSVEVNKTIRISVNGSGVQWNLKLLVDGVVVATNSELENFESNKSISFSYQYTPTSIGTKTVQLQGTVTEFSDGSTVRNFSPVTITVTEPAPVVEPEPQPEPQPEPTPQPDPEPQKPTVTKSSDAKLKSLSVSVGTLVPEFSPNVTEYTLNVGEEVSEIEIDARLNHSKATYSVSGNKELQPGENLIKVVGKAEDGTTKTYKINVIKAEQELALQTAIIRYTGENGEIVELTLTPEFSANILEYTMQTIPYTITDLVVDVIANKEDAIIEIEGNTQIKSGENKILIKVKTLNEDETINEEKVYTITYEKEAEPIAIADKPNEEKVSFIQNITLWLEQNEEKAILYCLMGCSAMLTILSIYMIADYKKHKKLVQELKVLKGEDKKPKHKKGKHQKNGEEETQINEDLVETEIQEEKEVTENMEVEIQNEEQQGEKIENEEETTEE